MLAGLVDRVPGRKVCFVLQTGTEIGCDSPYNYGMCFKSIATLSSHIKYRVSSLRTLSSDLYGPKAEITYYRGGQLLHFESISLRVCCEIIHSIIQNSCPWHDNAFYHINCPSLLWRSASIIRLVPFSSKAFTAKEHLCLGIARTLKTKSTRKM